MPANLENSAVATGLEKVSFYYNPKEGQCQRMFRLTYTCQQGSFHMKYSAYKLNEQGNDIQPWYTPLPVWNQSVVPCPVLTLASWPAYRFLRKQVRWSGMPISLRIFHCLLWSTLSKASASQWSRSRWYFLEFSCFFLWFNGCWQFGLWFLYLF